MKRALPAIVVALMALSWNPLAAAQAASEKAGPASAQAPAVNLDEQFLDAAQKGDCESAARS